DPLSQVIVKREEGDRIIPAVNDRKTIIATAHDTIGSIHPGAQATLLKLKQQYWWPNMIKDIKAYISTCEPCQVTNPTVMGSVPYLRPSRPSKPFDKFVIDYIGP
ncbi:polymerase, partial [Molossus molossus foamy virus 1]